MDGRRDAKRARKVFWLDPEPRGYWDTGDSIVSEYAPYCDGVYEVRNLRQLQKFVDRRRRRRLTARLSGVCETRFRAPRRLQGLAGCASASRSGGTALTSSFCTNSNAWRCVVRDVLFLLRLEVGAEAFARRSGRARAASTAVPAPDALEQRVGAEDRKVVVRLDDVVVRLVDRGKQLRCSRGCAPRRAMTGHRAHVGHDLAADAPRVRAGREPHGRRRRPCRRRARPRPRRTGVASATPALMNAEQALGLVQRGSARSSRTTDRRRTPGSARRSRPAARRVASASR